LMRAFTQIASMMTSSSVGGDVDCPRNVTYHRGAGAGNRLLGQSPSGAAILDAP